MTVAFILGKQRGEGGAGSAADCMHAEKAGSAKKSVKYYSCDPTIWHVWLLAITQIIYAEFIRNYGYNID